MSDRSDSEPYMQNVQRRLDVQTIDIQRSHIAALTAELAATREKLGDDDMAAIDLALARKEIATLTAQRDGEKAAHAETLRDLERLRDALREIAADVGVLSNDFVRSTAIGASETP